MAKRLKREGKVLKGISESPPLEQLLWALNGMRKCQVFPKRLRRDADGRIVNPLTKKGAELYDRLSDFLHGVANLAKSSDEPYTFDASRVMDSLDEIVDFVSC